MSLREDLELTERESSLGYDNLEDRIECDVKEADWIGDYLLKGEGEYKYLFDKGRWYVVRGLYHDYGVMPIKHPIPIAKAIEMGLW